MCLGGLAGRLVYFFVVLVLMLLLTDSVVHNC